MIGFNLSGGLGNNLFQIATAASLAKSLNTTWKANPNINRGVLGSYVGNLLEWNLIFEPIENLDPEFVPSEFAPKYFHSDLSPGTGWKYVEVDPRDNFLYSGYFQSPKYFKNLTKKEIQSLFKIKEPLKRDAKEWITEIKNKYQVDNVVGVHLRIGNDKELDQVKHYHSSPSIEYYKKAFSLIDKDSVIAIVSDDMEKASYLKKAFPDLHIIGFPNSHSIAQAFTVLACCDKVIVGNSTFSWWAAFLNPTKAAPIVPKTEWFGPGYSHFETSHMFPDHWIKF